MQKKQLMEYLSACTDAENALYACNRTIESLASELKKLPHPYPPDAPEKGKISIKEKAQFFDESPTIPRIICGIVGIFTGVSISEVFHISIDTDSALSFFLFWFILPYNIGTNIYLFIRYSAKSNKIAQKYQNENNRIEEQYNREHAQYMRQMAEYQNQSALIDATKQYYNSTIQKLEQKKSTLTQQLNNLYSRGVLHVNFQNQIAVSSILSYFEMGLCTSLGGPDGAYSKYLDALYANQIITSIQEMERNVVSAVERMGDRISRSIGNMQTSLAYEIRSVGENTTGMLTALQSSVNDGMHSISSWCHDSSRSVNELNHSISGANKSLQNIEHILSSASHNQYIGLRMQNISNYLLENP